MNTEPLNQRRSGAAAAASPAALVATLVAALLATLLATLLGAPPARAAAGAAPARIADPTSGVHEARADMRHTRLTFEVPDCEKCEIQLAQARRKRSARVRVWTSRLREVRDGTVTFRPATRRTRGLSVTVRAPWEGQTGYLTTLAWRYGNTAVGDPISLEEAVTKNRASACWKGTRRRSVSIPLVVKEVEVAGVHERVPGSIAFVPVTRSWLRPMREVWDGVLGSQDVNICR